jgi:hypothetical protein
MNLPTAFYVYMTTSMADRSDAATWGSRQPPPSDVQAYERRTACTFRSDGFDAQTDVYKRFLELRTVTLAIATALPAIPEALAGAPAMHVAKKTLTTGAQ